MIISYLLPDSSSAYFALFQLIFWLLNLILGLVGLFASLYLIIVHDDMQQNAIPPAELADYIHHYVPIEYVCSVGYFLFAYEASGSGMFWLNILTLPLVLYNISRYLAKDHKLYFITKSEYKQNFRRMELQYQVKSVYYALLFAIALVMSIFRAIEFFGLI